ncbi:MAG: calcium-translocating P-type ATPase, PMCA-type [Firmicutes bacterium]|nr:calcium-translocating P-type ATPase, PMCA-type [Bacillota bacterium]
MDWHRLGTSEVINKLNSSEKFGLDESGILASIKKYGKNELSKPKRKSIFSKIGNSLLEPMMMILLFAFGITLTVNIIRVFRGDSFDWAESIGIFFAIVLSIGISIFMERKSEKAFEALKRVGENSVIKVVRSGKVVQLNQSELVVGDILYFGVGDKIPVDCRLIKSDGLETDESALTGESMAVKKNAEKVFGTNENPPLAERTNMIYGGTFVVAGSSTAIAVAVGDSTELGVIAKELKKVVEHDTPLQQKLNGLGKIIAIFGAFSALFVFVVQLTQLIAMGTANFENIQNVFINSIVLIVAAVPEGLPTIVAVSLALNVILMARYKALVKRPSAVETIGSVSIICSDKTGTLTENRMTVSEFNVQCSTHNAQFRSYIDLNICANSSADLDRGADGNYKFIGNPTECAMLVAFERDALVVQSPTSSELCRGRTLGVPPLKYQQLRQSVTTLKTYAFSSEYKRMTTVINTNSQRIVLVKGAPEVVLGLCSVDKAIKDKALHEIGIRQKQAKRVIAFGFKILDSGIDINDRTAIEKGLIFGGFVAISDPIRKEVFGAVEASKRAGVAVKMLTGDHLATARAIAIELGISKGEGIFEASEIEKMTDKELECKVSEIKVVARSTPSLKLRIVEALKRQDEVVAVTGDGINDAPAIKSADVGIAMGIAGTEVTKEASDIVLLDDSFSTLVTSIKFGRGIYENFQRFMLFQLTVNFAAVFVTVACILLGVGAPFNTLQLLWINIIMDGPPALTLGLEPIYDGLMERKPVRRGESIITKSMMSRIAINGIFIATIVVLQATTNFIGIDTTRERTFLFTLFIIFQLFNTFNARELGNKSIFKNFTRNKIMLVVIAVAIILQIIITQFGGRMFGTVGLGFTDWLKVFGLGMLIIVFNEGYKCLLRKSTKITN